MLFYLTKENNLLEYILFKYLKNKINKNIRVSLIISMAKNSVQLQPKFPIDIVSFVLSCRKLSILSKERLSRNI